MLDYSIDKYGRQLVHDLRTLKRIVVLYLPLPIFYTLHTQIGSRWTFQAKQLNGNLGFYHLKPDQLRMADPLLVLILIPLFDAAIYPILRRLGFWRPLQKMTAGGIFMAISFVCAGLLQLQIESKPERTVHILWQLPQYFAYTVADVMFSLIGKQKSLHTFKNLTAPLINLSVPFIGLGFSYEEAPKSMKSIITAYWLLIMAVGNSITLIFVSNNHLFDRQSHEFIFFAGLMFVATIIFGILAYFYKSSIHTNKEQSE